MSRDTDYLALGADICRPVTLNELPVHFTGEPEIEGECPDCGREIYVGCDVDCDRVGCRERR